MIDLAPLKPLLKGKPIAIVGLGKSGLHAHEACKAAGIETVLWDDNETGRKNLPTEDLRNADFSRFALLCLAPGIPLTHPKPHPAAVQAQKAGCPVVCDIELFHLAHPKMKTIGITGTNGKSTTTALIGHILKTAGVEHAVGGNIGEASLSLPQLSLNGVYVFELSSYQLDLCPTFSPNISLLINLSPDHLDRHGDMNGYITAKKKIFRGEGTAIIGIDDDWSQQVYSDIAKAKRKTIPVSCLTQPAGGIYVTATGTLTDRGCEIFNLKECRTLQGQHNWQNSAITYAACTAQGINVPDIINGFKTFPGLAHRQNIVAVYEGITYINDSKATNDQAAAMALRTYNPIYWIAGGKPKDGGYPDCEQYLNHVRHAFLIGEGEAKMAAWLRENKTPFTRASSLDTAVAAAHDMAMAEKRENAVVLLSPACASFDQFKSFEHRGDAFVALVKRLAP
jgi:UDP-N-acetylmuramoylalanine--D-glutamate ligase